MSWLDDRAVSRLQAAATWPELDTDRYTVVAEIGRGGMGTVYLARDETLGRDVAIKVSNAVASDALEHRIRNEARILARLEHPGIVPIHDVGRLMDGRLFYVMKRVRGETLLAHLARPGGFAPPDPPPPPQRAKERAPGAPDSPSLAGRGPQRAFFARWGEATPAPRSAPAGAPVARAMALPSLGERLRVFERICDPVAFAHAQGCIHRDLKPENIMIGAFGEVMVMDWGVAKTGDTGGESSPAAPKSARETSAGTVLGTPGYMSPEQASGEAADARTDVYGLGAILFTLLTGEPPPADPAAAAARISEMPGVPRLLRAICIRALAARPAGRYQDVAALTADLARFRAGQAVDAHHETIVERSARFARTYRTPILLVLAYMLMRAIVAFVAGR